MSENTWEQQQFISLSCETYWQSDGQLPHLVNVQVTCYSGKDKLYKFNAIYLQFRRKTTVSEVAIYTDYKLDESYTPTRQAPNSQNFRYGNNFRFS